MARSLKSYRIPERDKAIARRLREGITDDGTVVGGLGYWAARDAMRYRPIAVAPAAPTAHS